MRRHTHLVHPKNQERDVLSVTLRTSENTSLRTSTHKKDGNSKSHMHIHPPCAESEHQNPQKAPIRYSAPEIKRSPIFADHMGGKGQITNFCLFMFPRNQLLNPILRTSEPPKKHQKVQCSRDKIANICKSCGRERPNGTKLYLLRNYCSC